MQETPGSRFLGPLRYSWASLVAQLVKNQPAMWEIWVQSLGWEDALEKAKAPVFWPGEFHGLAKNRTQLSDFHFHFSLFGIVRNVESHKAKLRDKKGTVVFV